MSHVDEMETQVQENKMVRGYILRCLAKGSRYQLLVRQIANIMINSGVIISPDIGKPLAYLEEGGYITYPDQKVNSYNAYSKDAIVKLTKSGIDLVEGTLEDEGVNI